MSRWAMVLSLALLLSTLAAACSPAAANRQPPTVAPYSGGARLDFDNHLVDFGDVQYDKPLTATFHLKNIGDRPLVLKKVDLKLVQGC